MVPITIPGIGLRLALAPIRICPVVTRYLKMDSWTIWIALAPPYCDRWSDSPKISTKHEAKSGGMRT